MSGVSRRSNLSERLVFIAKFYYKSADVGPNDRQFSLGVFLLPASGGGGA